MESNSLRYSLGSLEGGRSSTSMSIVYSPVGLIDPFTVTLSMYLVNLYIAGVKFTYKSLEINNGIPNYLVPASNLAAIFTCGDKYDASILNSEPIAPSIPHPECRPYPIFTL
jgi:hypothetical protein